MVLWGILGYTRGYIKWYWGVVLWGNPVVQWYLDAPRLHLGQKNFAYCYLDGIQAIKKFAFCCLKLKNKKRQVSLVLCTSSVGSSCDTLAVLLRHLVSLCCYCGSSQNITYFIKVHQQIVIFFFNCSYSCGYLMLLFQNGIKI